MDKEEHLKYKDEVIDKNHELYNKLVVGYVDYDIEAEQEFFYIYGKKVGCVRSADGAVLDIKTKSGIVGKDYLPVRPSQFTAFNKEKEENYKKFKKRKKFSIPKPNWGLISLGVGASIFIASISQHSPTQQLPYVDGAFVNAAIGGIAVRIAAYACEKVKEYKVLKAKELELSSEIQKSEPEPEQDNSLKSEIDQQKYFKDLADHIPDIKPEEATTVESKTDSRENKKKPSEVGSYDYEKSDYFKL